MGIQKYFLAYAKIITKSSKYYKFLSKILQGISYTFFQFKYETSKSAKSTTKVIYY